MKITRAYKTELDPNNQQRTQMYQHAGAVRFVYNWGLARKKALYDAGEKVLSAQKLDTELRAIIDEQFPWLRDVCSHSRQQALADLDSAYKHFFRRIKEGKGGKEAGFPKPKKKSHGIGGFTVFSYTVRSDAIRLPKMGWVRLKEKDYLPIGGYGKNTETVRFYGARVTETAGKWFVSVQVEIEQPNVPEVSGPKTPLGVHLGIRVLATDSLGRTFENPRPLERKLRTLQRLEREKSRRKKGSANRRKTVKKIAKLHALIADQRRHTQHHVSHVVTKKANETGVIMMESWDLPHLMGETPESQFVARGFADSGLGEIRRQVSYKATWRGGQQVLTPQDFASTRTCHCCGQVREQPVKGKTWTCECGARHDREENAAKNLENAARSLKAA